MKAVFANEDEARELVGGGAGSECIEKDTKIEQALSQLAEWCEIAVITLGDKGCLAQRGDERVEQKAFKGFAIEDTTGAGDLFASGFMYGVLRNHSLQRCCEIGCLSGAAVVQVMGAEVSNEGWTWLHAHLHEVWGRGERGGGREEVGGGVGGYRGGLHSVQTVRGGLCGITSNAPGSLPSPLG